MDVREVAVFVGFAGHNLGADLIAELHVRRTFDPDHGVRLGERIEASEVGLAGDKGSHGGGVISHRSGQ